MQAKEKVKRAFDLKVFLTRGSGRRKMAPYAENAVIFSQGDPADAIYYIHKGKVKLTVLSDRERKRWSPSWERAISLAKGAWRVSRSAWEPPSRMSECSIMKLEKADVIRVLHEQPSFSELFVAHLLSRNIRIEEDLVDQLFNSSEKRLARVLLLLANFGKEGTPQTVIPKISQETLAGIIGTTRSRVSFFMNRFRKLGFIEYNGGLKIHSSLLNVVLHD